MVYRPAGFWIRLGAILLDAVIIGFPIVLLTVSLGFNQFQTDIFHGVVEFFYSLIIPVLWSGYTLGKRICVIRIVKLNGDNVTLGTMIMRNVVGGIVYLITFGIGVIVSIFMVALREDKRALHDLIAGTYVTHRTPEEVLDDYEDAVRY